jgi:hypothetical protein
MSLHAHTSPEKHRPASRPPSDAEREAVEETFFDWWAENFHALEAGLPGDVLDLRLRLNAALTKASNSSESGASDS